jgi:hypothetical protein
MSNARCVISTVSAAAILLCHGLSAQPPADAPAQDTVFFMAHSAPIMPFGGPIDVLTGEGSVMGQVITGKPYSADSVTESTQMLADGNRISQRNEARLYRDAQGRTRREHRLSALGVFQTVSATATLVTINDPVADLSYFLDPVARTARQLRPFTLATSAEPGREMALPAPPPVVLPAPLRGEATLDVTVVSGDAIGDRSASTGEHVIARAAEEIEIALPPIGGAVAMGTFSPAGAAIHGLPGLAQVDSVTEQLGEQVLEGVLARGTRQTHTIPAGAMGNERPIEVVTEQWHSDELEALLLRKHYDPRFGEIVYRLVNVDRSEPPPELFTVPQDYSLQSDVPPRLQWSGASSMPEIGADERIERRVIRVQPNPVADPE